MKPPVAPQRPHVHTEHGVERDDPWYWLRDKKDPETIAYVEAENAYSDEVMEPLADLRKELYDEMLGRIQETDTGARIRKGPYVYYSRTVEGQAYAIHCRQRVQADDTLGDEEIVVDENQVAEGHEYFSMAAATVSPDHGRLAYTTDTTGNEIYDLTVIDLSTRKVLDRLSGISGGVCWANDSRHLFWRELDDAQRPWRVHVRDIEGDAPATLAEARDSDMVIFTENDTRFRAGIGRTRSGKYLLLYAAHQESTEFWLVDGDDPLGTPRCVQRRADGLVYDVEVAHDKLWIRSTDGDIPSRKAVTYRLYTAPLGSTGRDDWTLFLDARPDVPLEDAAVFRNHLVREERVNGVVQIVVRDLRSGEEHTVAMAEDSYVASIGWSPEYDGGTFHYGYSSLTTPASTYRYDMETREAQLLKQTPVPNYEPDAYRSARIDVPSRDGTLIPASVVWKALDGDDGSVPTGRAVVLYGYGSYGITVEPAFRSTRVPLLDRGVVFVIAHIRGGGFLGRGWYEASKFHTKERTFDDFIDVGRHLIDQGITRKETLGIMGGSAGGMLMGGVMNRAPDLCQAVVAMVPFVDCVTTMLDESLPLTAGEWVEWGDPREEAYFRTMLAYSPYDNVAEVHYPNVLVTSGLNDPRVQYWEPTKWVAKLRATMLPGSELLLHTHMGAGHQGKSGRYGYLEDAAMEYGWLLDQIGATEKV